MTVRILAGILFAIIVGALARRTRALSTSGALAAGLVGALATIAGWNWAALLIVYFAVATALSHFGADRKEARTRAVVAKAGPRDARQVFANGGPFAFAALGAIVAPHPAWSALACGSIAASASDTWSTEIGTLRGGEPRSIVSWRRVPPGTSGGITAAGTLAGAVGALFTALVCLALGWPRSLAIAVLVAGFAGGLTDSLLGGTVQTQRWCDACDKPTERELHSCGANTRITGGVRWLDNDAVNLAATLTGGLLAVALAR